MRDNNSCSKAMHAPVTEGSPTIKYAPYGPPSYLAEGAAVPPQAVEGIPQLKGVQNGNRMRK